MKVLENYSLLKHNTFGIDAKCSRFVEYATVEDLCTALQDFCKNEHAKFLHIGGGSNLLFTKDFEGTILHSAILGKECIRENGDDVYLRVGAGEIWDDFVAWCVEHGYYGLENLSYIPGEVGASAVQNIGAYGKEVCEFIDSVETVAVATGQPRVFKMEECQYAYRYSTFKAENKGKYIVTHVVFRLSKTFCPDLQYAALSRELTARNIPESTLTAQALRNLVVDVRRSKLPEPSEIGSAGSFFMNPVVDKEVADRLLAQYPNMPHYLVEKGVKVPAGWLIDQCGWKGRRMGNAGVYEKQALVLVNCGGATGEDICTLSKAVQQDVKEKFGISIYPEVNFI